jgi:hypothetical protein
MNLKFMKVGVGGLYHPSMGEAPTVKSWWGIASGF